MFVSLFLVRIPEHWLCNFWQTSVLSVGRSFVRKLVRLLVHSCFRSLSDSFVRLLVGHIVCSCFRSLSDSFVRLLVGQLVCSCFRSLSHSFVCSLVSQLVRSVPLSLTLTLLRLILFILSAVDHKVTQSLTLINPFFFSGFGNPDYHHRGGDSCSHLHFDSCPFRYLLCQRNTSQQARGKRIVSKLNTKTDW